MSQYNPSKIESKWQKIWQKSDWSRAKDGAKKPKFYCLVEFPYPSGTGLHVGHLRSYSALDAVVRYKRMNGFNVLYPMGWDAFGLPAENYAIKTGVQPQITTRQNIANYKKQMTKMGLSFDWSREVNTTDPRYYKWTQWIFLQLFKKGLAYQKEMPVNWCPACKIGLANEEVVAGKCERCGAVTTTKNLKQWMLKITAYADRLLKDLDAVDYAPRIREQQINWIGRSEGVEIEFHVICHSRLDRESGFCCHPLARPEDLMQRDPRIKSEDDKLTRPMETIRVFTTRPDTIFGATYLVVCPEHPIISNLKLQISNWQEVQKYIEKATTKSDLERTDLAKEKTGVKLEGVSAINPANNKEIPIFVADYVLPHYGTGAIMAVPAHDERDMEFAKKYDLPILQTVALNLDDYQKTTAVLNVLAQLKKVAQKQSIKFWVLSGLACAFYAKTIYRRHEDLDLIAQNTTDFHKLIDVFGQAGFKKSGEKKLDEETTNVIFKNDVGIEIDIGLNKYKYGLTDADFERQEKNLAGTPVLVLSKRFVKSFKEMQCRERNKDKDRLDLEFLNGRVITEDGFAINSGQFDGLPTSEFKKQITQWLEKNKLGKKAVNYKLRDWVFSRQHYWGEPIPLVFCENCGTVAVPEKDLPVKLPRLEKYQPTGTGESPLASATKWVNTQCPKCGGPAKRETDTMPNWAGSSWYFLRYCDAHNDKRLADSRKLKYWLPVDLYNGGMEHTTLHLLYSRFWHKFLYDIGAVPTSEPYAKRRSHGVVLAQDSQKMSKSRGNVVNPDEMIKIYGADSLRVYEMFMGPFSQMISWSTQGLVGVRRFLERVWALGIRLGNVEQNGKWQMANGKAKTQKPKEIDAQENIELQNFIHRTIKKISEDLEAMRFNTAVAALMILTNRLSEATEQCRHAEFTLSRRSSQRRRILASSNDAVDSGSRLRVAVARFGEAKARLRSCATAEALGDTRSINSELRRGKAVAGMTACAMLRRAYEILLVLLAPFAPHISEELWQQLGHKKSIFLEKWPQYSPKLIRQNTFDLVIQINGKLRDRVKAEISITQQQAEKLAQASKKIQQFLSDKQIKKVVFVRDKLINLVV